MLALQPPLTTGTTLNGYAMKSAFASFNDGASDYPPLDEVVSLYDSRRSDFSDDMERCRYMLEHYNGDVAVYLPELDRKEQVAVANFFAQGIDQHGMRLGSILPMIDCPPLKPGNRKSEHYGAIRKKATTGWLEYNEYDIKMYRRARHLIAYACAPVSIHWNYKLQIPNWRLRHPLNSFPAATQDPDDMCPDNVIYDFQRSLTWLKQNYGPELIDTLRRRTTCTPDSMFTLIEYQDADVRVLAVIGDRSSASPNVVSGFRGRNSSVNGGGGWSGTQYAIELERTTNRAGICTYVTPGRVTLDRPQGQFDSSIGIFQQQAKMMALELDAVTRSIYQDTWAVSNPGDEVEIVRMADGLAGIVGEVHGGSVINVTNQPGFQTYPTLDRLERAQRQNGLIPAEYGGESASNIRTGVRGGDVLSNVVDFNIQQGQKTFARSEKHELERAIALAKAYGGNSSKSFYVSWKGGNSHVDYVPNKHFEPDAPIVIKYAQPGTDRSTFNVGMGQLLSLEIWSKQTARETHPDIVDPELERDRIIAEGLDAAMMSSLQTRAQSGELPADDVAVIKKLILEKDMDLESAIIMAQEMAQQRQAQQVPPDSPMAQPGMANPGMGAEAAAVQPPEPSVANLASTMSTLRQSIRQTPQERASSAPLS